MIESVKILANVSGDNGRTAVFFYRENQFHMYFPTLASAKRLTRILAGIAGKVEFSSESSPMSCAHMEFDIR